MNGENTVRDAGIANPLNVLRRAEPEISGPDLHAELAVEKNRRKRTSAAEVQHPHAGPQLDCFREPLGQPQRISSATDTGKYPLGVVTRRAWKPIAHQPLICAHVVTP